MFCSLYNSMKQSRNIFRFHSKQTCMSMTRCEGVRVARRFLALFGEQSFIFVQDLNTSFHNIHKIPLTRSGFEIMFLYFIKSARFDARLNESPSNASMWKYTFGCWRQWQEPNLTRPAVFRGENTGSSPNSGWIPSLRNRGCWISFTAFALRWIFEQEWGIYKHIQKKMSWLQGHSTVPKSWKTNAPTVPAWPSLRAAGINIDWCITSQVTNQSLVIYLQTLSIYNFYVHVYLDAQILLFPGLWYGGM